MFFARVGQTGYNIVLLLHIVSIFVAVAPSFAIPALTRKMKSSGADLGLLAKAQAEIIQKLSLPALIAAGIFGGALVGMSDKQFQFEQSWLSASAIIWIIMIVIGFVGILPAVKTFAANPEPKNYGKIMMFTGINHLLLVVIMYFMIFKPGV